MTGTPEGSTESGFMEKPAIEHATPGLVQSLLPKDTLLRTYLRSLQPWLKVYIAWFIKINGLKKSMK